MLHSANTATKKSQSSVMSSTQVKQSGKPSPSSQRSIFINFIAGGVGGTAGVVVTCPLDVVQTRLQSSMLSLQTRNVSSTALASTTSQSTVINMNSNRFGLNVFCYIKHMVKTEGIGALYKGLVPNLIGIAPSRAIYFSVYTKTKTFLTSTHLSNSSWTHMLSALSASWLTSTMTNPIWFLKTRLQLDMTSTGKRRPLVEVIKEVFQNEGIRGFYRGLSASYIGAAETMVYFVLYEKLKIFLTDVKVLDEKLTSIDYITAAFLAKSIATVSVYPHEVARTRLRQESSKLGGKKKYYGFFQTLAKVYKEEQMAGLYGGMGAHLMRQVPNTVIMFLTYETIVNFFVND
ncbi:solute carrier family 25 member 36-like [Hydractinia symbiolongicarpus]|uniref:solute carrier family 25 member 36-like n=1 Tax=Hydractinia symbiolongicarpus TaxID=13093 RepID=UPI00254AB5A8|nr:solute carrier family 25 member 36-like [Hydractinia symbiolongicarpus]